MLCTIALLKHMQIPSDISFGIYFRKPKLLNLVTFKLKIQGKLKIKDDFKIVAIVAKSKFETEAYDSWRIRGFSKCLVKSYQQKEFL